MKVKSLVVLTLGTTIAMSLLGPAGGRPLAGARAPVFDEPDPLTCLEATPAAAGVSGVTDNGARVELDVRVLLDIEEGYEIAELLSDDESSAQGQGMLDEAAAAAHARLSPATVTYSPLGIDLKLSYELLWPLNGAGERVARPSEADGMIEAGKAQFGGKRPIGTDVVFVLTDQDVEGAVAGKADCIGGVRFDDSSFAYGEFDPEDDEPFEIGPVGLFPHYTAKIFAHEVGHLLGAHHHYSSCVEGLISEPVADAASVCTLMINDIGLASLNFSTLNGVVVRGHATGI